MVEGIGCECGADNTGGEGSRGGMGAGCGGLVSKDGAGSGGETLSIEETGNIGGKKRKERLVR
jgi:hypothetical protein